MALFSQFYYYIHIFMDSFDLTLPKLLFVDSMFNPLTQPNKMVKHTQTICRLILWG